MIPAQLDQLRKKEKLRELFGRQPAVPPDLAALAADLGPQAGLDQETALPWLASFVADAAPVAPHPAGESLELAAPVAADSDDEPGARTVASSRTTPKKKPRPWRSARVCKECSAPLKVGTGAGRLPSYCSNACRQRAHRRRKAESAA